MSPFSPNLPPDFLQQVGDFYNLNRHYVQAIKNDWPVKTLDIGD